MNINISNLIVNDDEFNGKRKINNDMNTSYFKLVKNDFLAQKGYSNKAFVIFDLPPNEQVFWDYINTCIENNLNVQEAMSMLDTMTVSDYFAISSTVMTYANKK